MLTISQFLEKLYKMYFNIVKLIFVLHKIRYKSRDKFTCQYCGKILKNPKERTIDHIIPKSRGGKTIWSNVVLCCKKCNLKKGDKTPEEAGLKLLKTPKAPRWQALILEEFPKHKREKWKVFLNFAGIFPEEP